MKINHNVTAQLANVSLKKNDRRIATSLERLSSGYKITKAADDAAGLAISNKMKAQIRALDRSSRNAEDGTSIIETADGAMAEIESIAQRIRELCVQASNDTYNLDDRAAIQSEVDEMLDEMDRIAETTEFNSKGLLNGNASRTVFSDKDSVKAISSSLGVEAGNYSFSINKVAEPASVSIALPAIPVSEKFEIDINDTIVAIEPDDTLESATKKIIDVCDKMNISVDNSTDFTLTTNAAGWLQRIEVEYPDGTTLSSQGSNAEIKLNTTPDADTKTAFESSASYIADGNNILISDNSGFEMQVELTSDAKAGDDVTLTVFDAGYMTIQIGANEHQNLNMDFPEISCQTLALRDWNGVDKINVCTQVGATNAISSLDTAITRISAARSQLGSYQNRLESTISSLDIGVENMTDAMSRITDTDMASEMTEYTQLSVLTQAATTMLSQANTRVETVMSLLQGKHIKILKSAECP